MDCHKRFRHDETDLQCSIGHRRTQLHLFSCLNTRPHRDKIISNLGKQLYLDESLDTSEGKIFSQNWRLQLNYLRSDIVYDLYFKNQIENREKKELLKKKKSLSIHKLL